jgi:hypothetical protein
VPEPLFEPSLILATLAEHRVEFVVVGGIAAILHGAPTVTSDADVCPSRDPKNLERLCAALEAMDARIRTVDSPNGHPFACDAALLSRVKMLNLITRFGTFDLTFDPAGFPDYELLASRATEMSIDGHGVLVAALDDVIRSKELANRPKDHATLPILYALRDEIARREREG